MVVLGLSPDTIARGARVVTDEIEHARLAHGLYLRCGGPMCPVPLDGVPLSHTDDPDAPLPWRTVSAAAALAIEETVSLAVFAARLRDDTDPEVRAALERLIRDEAVHRAFAWDLLDELVEGLGLEAALAWARPRLAWWLRGYLLLHPRRPRRFDGAQRRLGLLDADEQWSVMRGCLEEEVLPRFASRDLLEPGVDAAALEREAAGHGGRPPPGAEPR